MKLKIMHVCETLPGGVASYLRELYPHQAREYGVENISFVLPSSQIEFLGPRPPENIFLWDRSGRNPKSFLNLTAVLWRAIESFRPNIVHLHSTYAGVLGRVVCLLHKQPCIIVYCPHGWAFSMDVSCAQKVLYALAERILAHLSDGIINISNHEAIQALTWGVRGDRQRTILNGIDERVVVKSRRKDENGPIQLLFVGRHDPQKGLDVLLDAFKYMPRGQLSLNIVGGSQVSGGDAYSDTSEDITFSGWVDRDKIFQMMADVDAVVIPSRWEGFGLVAIEAFRSGVPVIASDRGALPELISDGSNGYIFDLESKNLADVLLSLRRSDLKRMGTNARDTFLEKYKASDMSKNISQFYIDLLNKKHSPCEKTR